MPTGNAVSAGPSFVSLLDPAAPEWSRLPRFPSEDAAQRRAGDELIAELDAVLGALDADEIDRVAAFPEGLVERLRAGGFFALRNDARHPSDHTVFRVIEHAARCSVAVGQLIGVQNGIGAAALLPALPPGPLREFVGGHVDAGTLSGLADTELGGHNNSGRDTVAVSTEDGSAYRLDGAKRFICLGSVAGLLGVTAVVRDRDGRARPGLVFVDTASPGVTVTARHEFLGGRGLPNGSLRFDSVLVPAERVLAGPGSGGAGSPPSVGRLLFNAAPAVAIVRECQSLARDFVADRTIDGRPLAEYEQVQRFFATALADTYALDGVIRWCLLGADRGFEQLLAKNICTRAAWRIADQTVSMLGGAGLETASSARNRGARPRAAERLLRDARGLRVSGNVDFLLDIQAGRALLARHVRSSDPYRDWLGPLDDAGLSPGNRAHLLALAEDLRRLSRTCADLARRYRDAVALPGGQQTLRLIGHIAGELLTVFVVLARAPGAGGELADLYCTTAWHRLAGLWHELSAPARDVTSILRGNR
jgi:alkylation response protein AidB-like acyl-CoA dehydrogenase